MSAKRHPFQVRKVTSGRVSGETWIVVMNPGGRRVSVHAHHSRRSAQLEADDLNVGAMVKPHAEDPRPYAERLAEAQAAYDTEREDTP